MKITLLTLVFTFSTSLLAETKMSTATCLKLMTSTTADVFYNDDSHHLLVANGLYDKQDSDLYFKNVVTALNEKLGSECTKNRDSYTLEKFKKTYADTCKVECREGVTALETTVINSISKSNRGIGVCATFCKQGVEKLDLLKQGIDMAKADSEKPAQDCSGAVANTTRTNTPKTSFDKIDTVVKKAVQK